MSQSVQPPLADQPGSGPAEPREVEPLFRENLDDHAIVAGTFDIMSTTTTGGGATGWPGGALARGGAPGSRDFGIRRSFFPPARGGRAGAGFAQASRGRGGGRRSGGRARPPVFS